MTGQRPDNMSEADRAQIKEFFIRERGYWRPWTDTMLQACPGFVEQYAHYAGYPARTGPLSPRMVELIYVALDSSSSHLFASGLQTHMRRAIEVGATQSDIFDVLHLVAIQGAASVCQAANILAECSGLHAEEALDERLQARINQLPEEHALSLLSIARMDPGYAEALLDLVEYGRPAAGGLTPSERSLVQLALHACFTAFNPEATRQIIVAALAQGVSRAELLQAIQLGAHLSVHGTALGADTFRAISQPPAPSPES
ncbi:carboxymuconolactone decarboxylase family protein [Ottowia caeni]|uniref:carboxymuconolactone decarboxylase family protein n=1 Tax=Ottowia caeni TaxID=2870339 RepID=UPI001E3F88C7